MSELLLISFFFSFDQLIFLVCTTQHASVYDMNVATQVWRRVLINIILKTVISPFIVAAMKENVILSNF